MLAGPLAGRHRRHRLPHSQDQQLARVSGQRHRGRLAGGAQPPVEDSEGWIVAGRRQGGHVPPRPVSVEADLQVGQPVAPVGCPAMARGRRAIDAEVHDPSGRHPVLPQR